MANDRADEWPSKSQIRKVGSGIRAHSRGEIDDAARAELVSVLVRHRRRFRTPLAKVNNGLWHLAGRAGVDAQVTQRLKRVPTIVEKLTRENGLDLSRMQDIGGCRAVVANLDELRELEKAVLTTWSDEVSHHKDYVDTPRESGYRAVHVVVRRDGCLIEIQLRTEAMHAWAQAIEDLSGVLGINYKHDGDSAIHEYGKFLSRLYVAFEAGKQVPEDLSANLDGLESEIRRMVADRHPEQGGGA